MLIWALKLNFVLFCIQISFALIIVPLWISIQFFRDKPEHKCIQLFFFAYESIISRLIVFYYK